MNNSTETDQTPEIDCKSLEEFIVDFLDEKLPTPTKQAFLKHIEECDNCNQYLQSYQQTISLSKAALTGTPSTSNAEIPEQLVEAILAAHRNL